MSAKTNALFRELDTHLCSAYIIASELYMELEGPPRRGVAAVRRKLELAMTQAIRAKNGTLTTKGAG